MVSEWQYAAPQPFEASEVGFNALSVVIFSEKGVSCFFSSFLEVRPVTSDSRNWQRAGYQDFRKAGYTS